MIPTSFQTSRSLAALNIGAVGLACQYYLQTFIPMDSTTYRDRVADDEREIAAATGLGLARARREGQCIQKWSG